MKVTILGCGSSGGVPLIGNDWGTCNRDNPRNLRMRPSILVENNGQSILVDTGPDMHHQLMTRNMSDLAAVLYTHAHADHCHGIDELRSINWQTQKPIPVYASAETLAELTTRFPYIFANTTAEFYKPSVNTNLIDGPFQIAGLNIQPFIQDHGYTTSLGFRFGDFAYSTDVKRLDEYAFKALEGVKTWVVDCVREEIHPTHSHFTQTLEWIARVKPERAYLTHMNQMMDYDTILDKCPPGVWPAHDGLVLEC